MTDRVRLITSRATSLLLCLGAATVFLLWEFAHRGVYAYAIYPIDDADEWRYTACSRLVSHGYALFTQVFSAQPPLLFVSLATGMHVFGDSILGARIVEIMFGLLGLLSSAGIAWILAGSSAGGVTCFLLAVSPGFLVYSHTVEAEGPMMALMSLSLALLLAYDRHRRLSLAIVSGLVLSLAILAKLFAVEALVPAVWLLASSKQTSRQKSIIVGLFLFSVALPVALDFALVSPAAQWDQVVRLHNRAAGVHLDNLTPPLDVFVTFFRLDIGLSILAALSSVSLLLLQRWRELIFVLSWVAGTVVMLLLFHPLFPHHPVILLSGLAVMAGAGIGSAIRGIQIDRRSALIPVVLGGCVYLAFAKQLVHADRHVLIPYTKPSVLSLTPYVVAHSRTTDFVATDDLALAEMAHRLVPPPLCDPSNVRLRAGYLSAQTLISATRDYRSPLVIPSFGIFQQVTAYMTWVRRHYTMQRVLHGDVVYLRRQ